MSRTRKDAAPKYVDESWRRGRVWHWWRSEPKWWRRLMKHRKRRAELRRALRSEDHEGQVYPLDKKPWVYFW